jgi:D-tyrosyl-tRNA(Tyr) deacylase
MIALLQRVSAASVTVAGEPIAAIKTGLLIFIGVERDDDDIKAERLASRVLTYRVFPDTEGKMNLSVEDTRGALLAVPQFTLAADTSKGTRASFTPAAAPEVAARLFDRFVLSARARGTAVECGKFGADMAVTLTNDGPVTFWLRT